MSNWKSGNFENDSKRILQMFLLKQVRVLLRDFNEEFLDVIYSALLQINA